MAVLSRRGLLAALAMSAAVPGLTQAQGLSDRNIFIIVPFTPGSGPDVLARIVGEELRKRWNQPVIIDNKPGASGNIGAAAAARTEPDGHTILLSVNTFLMNAALSKSLPYDPVKSFAPIVELATGSLVLAVHPSIPVKSTRELIAYAKDKPGQVTYASPGRGTPQHLAMELFKLTAGVDLRHVPYTGSAGAVKDLVGGHVGAMFVPVHTVLPMAAENQVRLLALGSEKRSTLAPDVPTLAEEGVSGFEVDLWYALSAPAGTPKDIIDRYNKVVNEILASPNVRDQFAKQGLVPVGGSPQQLAALIEKDLPRWAKVVKDAGITQE
ncbi:Bug family tripartite tricarboxylate transporter substrate binding protein [Microvirga arabica]|uniref:Bug family tripartite tricarboxylate transporter substrate binding protein n=1 Tax=Microvirga arabica TaxID=1128671 RepID=UPI001939956C|nr:tripartite tricarboxylate transporter substrate binding protein [Microvirga arabica]MBM1174681.1 tripartite tricarboxylate transporter substrate binding protein [Microvirga arabica]